VTTSAHPDPESRAAAWREAEALEVAWEAKLSELGLEEVAAELAESRKAAAAAREAADAHASELDDIIRQLVALAEYVDEVLLRLAGLDRPLTPAEEDLNNRFRPYRSDIANAAAKNIPKLEESLTRSAASAALWTQGVEEVSQQTGVSKKKLALRLRQLRRNA
jgi:hypothetical protein